MRRRPQMSNLFPYPTLFLFFNDTATTEIYTLSLHDALPIYSCRRLSSFLPVNRCREKSPDHRSEEHTSELQSLRHLVCRLLLEKNTLQHYRSANQHAGDTRHRGRLVCPRG